MDKTTDQVYWWAHDQQPKSTKHRVELENHGEGRYGWPYLNTGISTWKTSSNKIRRRKNYEDCNICIIIVKCVLIRDDNRFSQHYAPRSGNMTSCDDVICWWMKETHPTGGHDCASVRNSGSFYEERTYTIDAFLHHHGDKLDVFDVKKLVSNFVTANSRWRWTVIGVQTKGVSGQA